MNYKEFVLFTICENLFKSFFDVNMAIFHVITCK